MGIVLTNQLQTEADFGHHVVSVSAAIGFSKTSAASRLYKNTNAAAADRIRMRQMELKYLAAVWPKAEFELRVSIVCDDEWLECLAAV